LSKRVTIGDIHNILHIVLLIVQIIIIYQFYTVANAIQLQNYEIQKTLYDFEPQINGFVNGIIWVYEYQHETTANIEIFINAPHSGNFTLKISNFYPDKRYIDVIPYLTPFSLKETIRDVTYPQTYRFKGDVKLLVYIYPKSNISPYIIDFPAGVLEFEVIYCDIAENKQYSKLFNGTVRYQFSQ